MSKIRIISAFLIFFIFLNLQAVLAQSGWVQQTSGTTKSIVDIQFLNANTGYAIAKYFETGECSVLKSTNGGVTWNSIFNPAPRILNALCFLNVNTGSVCGGNGTSIFKTTNSGLTWLPQQTPLSGDYYRGFHYQNADTAYTVGFSSIVRTTNSGENWITLYNLNEAFWSGIVFINQKTGIVAGGSTMRTTNSGANWLPVLISGVDISNSGENNIMVCGYGGIYKSTNYGAGFNQVYLYPSGEPGGLFGIRYLDSSTVICAGSSGRILKTTNNGTNWFSEQSNVTSTLFKASFINAFTGWIGGDNGVILKTTTGGVVTGFTNSNSEFPDKFSLSQNYPNPFNPSTNIKFQLPEKSFVHIIIYDMLGREVQRILSEELNAGYYNYQFNAENLNSGVYFYKLITDKFSETKRMVLVK